MEKEIIIYQEEGSSSVGEETGDCPIRRKPIVEVGTVAKEKSPEPSTSSSTSQSDLSSRALAGSKSANFFLKKDSIKLLQVDVFSPRASLSHNDYKAFVQDKLLLGKESHDLLEPTDISTEKWKHGAEGIKKVGLLIWDFLQWQRRVETSLRINKIQALLHPMKDSLKRSIMFDSSYHNMDLKFLLSKDSVKAILEVAKVERPLNNTIKGNQDNKNLKMYFLESRSKKIFWFLSGIINVQNYVVRYHSDKLVTAKIKSYVIITFHLTVFLSGHLQLPLGKYFIQGNCQKEENN
ncbi:unnamed protein product [Lepeophtheirus salmonis]|uniref:(salmon louse) hypothetical protein n=1 Tax=Lepeophtheirus salmonis TaxID=72036 RepID=A0A7R8CPX8_LEPSM|nr:unnamed protein product [Lepeophtheirus salmonis]CAF2890053.1 unnamed protein product [Lepeophtheirus salmonis]